eukprot:1266341-Pyramimonas_sp.AAC.1
MACVSREASQRLVEDVVAYLPWWIKVASQNSCGSRQCDHIRLGLKVRWTRRATTMLTLRRRGAWPCARCHRKSRLEEPTLSLIHI